jgi:hypothetical protein
MPASKPNIAPILPRSLSVALTDKAFDVIVGEAKARGVSPERLMLAATLDYLGRAGKTKGAKMAPFVLHFPWYVKKSVVETAAAAGVTPNHFMIEAARKALKAQAPIKEAVGNLTVLENAG